MKHHPIETVRRYFKQIQNDIAQLVQNTTPERIEKFKEDDLVRDALKQFLLSNKQNQQNNNQNNEGRKAIKQNQQQEFKKVQKMKKRMELQFQLTRKFIKQYSKNNNSNPVSQNSFLYSPRGIQPKPLNISQDFNNKVSITHQQNFKALNKLKKLQKFVYKNDRPGCVTTRNIPPQFTFSPSKDQYKHDNKRLKIELNNLKCQLQSVQNMNDIKLNEQLKQKQQKILKKQRSLSILQIQLLSKQQQLIKKQTQSMIRSKLSTRYL